MIIEIAWRSAVPVGAAVFVAAAMLFTREAKRTRKVQKKTEEVPAEEAGAGLLNSTTYRPTVHVHIMDVDRSNITVTDSGRVFGRCAVAGCEEPILLGNGFHPSLFNAEEKATDAHLSRVRH